MSPHDYMVLVVCSSQTHLQYCKAHPSFILRLLVSVLSNEAKGSIAGADRRHAQLCWRGRGGGRDLFCDGYKFGRGSVPLSSQGLLSCQLLSLLTTGSFWFVAQSHHSHHAWQTGSILYGTPCCLSCNLVTSANIY
jgi:hypothetical protein